MAESKKEDKTVTSAGDLLVQLYKSNKDNVKLDIVDDFFSNIANIQVNNADVTIDFLVLPGVNTNGALYVRGKRVHIPHSTAQRLAQILINSLDDAYKNNELDEYMPMTSRKDEESH